MKEFNYKRAHDEWALPKFHALSFPLKTLYVDVIEAYKGTHQNKSLGMDWLPGFEERFNAFDPEELAKAGHIIYGCGHWDYKGAGAWPRDDHGGYWKFELLVKQNLIARGYREYNKFKVPTGMFDDHKEGTGLSHDEICDQFKPLVSPEFTAVLVTTVNHKPDIFCIGAKHMKNSPGMILDPTSAPCATCGRPYAEHTFDTVLVLRRTLDEGDKLSDAEKAKLIAIQPKLTEHKLAGVAFTRA